LSLNNDGQRKIARIISVMKKQKNTKKPVK
jgi:hypothetical protein